jgi:hypothetical protein
VLITQNTPTYDVRQTTSSDTAFAVTAAIGAGPAPMTDLPTPGDPTDLTLLLLALAALLGPNKDDKGPIEDHARGFKQDLDFAWLS